MDPFDNLEQRLAELQSAASNAQQAAGASHAALQQSAGQREGAEIISTELAFTRFNALLSEGDLRQALVYLVGLSEYRYISIFRFQRGKATSVVHFDKEDPTIEQAGEVPDTATYCCFVRDKNKAFVTLDAATDAQTEDHVARHVIAAYCGVPILTAEGELLGTLCHYDTVPRDPAQLDLELLLQVASALAWSGKVPLYKISTSSTSQDPA